MINTYAINWKNEKWYENLMKEEQYIFDLIDKYHRYFSLQDRKYRNLVYIFKVVILLLALSSTIVLGLKSVFELTNQVNIGLILSSLITSISAVTSYFNFEEYWMRNIKIHIKLNIIRDNFIFDAEAGKLDKSAIEVYKKKLDEIQLINISYWEKAIKRI